MSPEGSTIHHNTGGGEDDDELTSWTVRVDTHSSLVQNELVYVLRPVVVQTARYPPQAPANERVAGHNCQLVARLKNRQQQSSVLEPINVVGKKSTINFVTFLLDCKQ